MLKSRKCLLPLRERIQGKSRIQQIARSKAFNSRKSVMDVTVTGTGKWWDRLLPCFGLF